MIVEKFTDRMTTTKDINYIPSDVTVDSTVSTETGRTSTSRIPKDLLAAVGKTEKSFDEALHEIRQSNYLPTKYSDGRPSYTNGMRSNLHKQLNALPSETDTLLGDMSSTDTYTGLDINDETSVQTDDQSQWSKNTFNPPVSTVMSAEKVEAKAIDEEANYESSKQGSALTERDELGHPGCESLKLEIHKNLKLHRLACDYFRFRNFLFFQVPQTFLAMASSILAFMGVSDILNVGSQKSLVTIAGCCSAVVVLLQTLSAYCGYGDRASMHDSTTIYLRDIDDDLALLMSKLMKTEIVANQCDDVESLQQIQKFQNNEDSFESLESRYRHSLKGCKSDVPTQITEAFSEIDSFILLSRTTSNRKFLMDRGMFDSQKFRGITLKSYDRLASNMVGSCSWPLRIPSPKTLVSKTIEETRCDLHQMNSFWETPPPKKESSLLCPSFGNTTTNMYNRS